MGTTQRKQISKRELLIKNQILHMEKAGDLSRNSFRYYTRKSTLQKIIDSKSLYISSFADMNDLEEAEMHEENKNSVFALCFCNTGSEGIPMWYMYSGIFGDGACLKFTPSQMLQMIKNMKHVYEIDRYYHNTGRVLEIGKDIDIQYGWVFYRDEQNDIFYKNQWYRIKDDQEGFLKQNYFVKSYPWSYEREFRIVFIPRVGINPYKIALPIPGEILEQINIIRGPETDESEIGEKCCLKIKMDLFSRNENEILEHLKENKKII